MIKFAAKLCGMLSLSAWLMWESLCAIVTTVAGRRNNDDDDAGVSL